MLLTQEIRKENDTVKTLDNEKLFNEYKLNNMKDLFYKELKKNVENPSKKGKQNQ